MVYSTIMASIMFKNTFLTIVIEEEVAQRLFPSKTIDLGLLESSMFMDSPSKASVNTDSCSTVAETEDLEAEQKAAAHACGECKPCAFSMKAGGCKNDDCDFCHEEHDKEFLKFIRKRNRAMRMAEVYGDAPRCAETYSQYSQHKKSCC